MVVIILDVRTRIGCATAMKLKAQAILKSMTKELAWCLECCFLYTRALCQKRFLYKSWLTHHIAKHMDPIHACEKWDRVFNRKVALKRHVEIIHNKKRHHCDQCPKDFSTNYGVLRHKKKTHSNENIRINCPKCSLTFGCLQDLGYQDNLTHTGLKPYICSNLLCNRAFETPYLLHKHKQVYEHRN